MTEHNWFSATDPLAMLDFLYPFRGHDSIEPQSRMSRLYLLACARRGWDRLPGVCRAVLAVAERVYRGQEIDTRLRKEIYSVAEELTHCQGVTAGVNVLGRELVSLGHATSTEVLIEADIDPELWQGFAHLAYSPFLKFTPHYRHIPLDLHSADLVREVFGNPIRKCPEFNPAWRTENVVQLTRHAHAEGDFSALPVLADALEEAGCDRADVLDHLRQREPHARGCWAIELVLE